MVRAGWRSAGLLSSVVCLLSFVPAVSAGYPDCRAVTMSFLFAVEPTSNRYFAIFETDIEEWREFNGYTGLQRNKCITETGLLLGRDTFVASVEVTPEGPGDLPEPHVPSLCGMPNGTPIDEVIEACLGKLPTPPGGLDPDELCRGNVQDCSPLPDGPLLDPVADNIDWLQFLLDNTLQGVLGSLPDP